MGARVWNLQVPKGRLKPRDLSAVPSGLTPVARSFPNVETLGYYRMSLRDKDSDTFSKSLPRSNPSGIGAPALRGPISHVRAELELCAPPQLTHCSTSTLGRTFTRRQVVGRVGFKLFVLDTPGKLFHPSGHEKEQTSVRPAHG